MLILTPPRPSAPSPLRRWPKTDLKTIAAEISRAEDYSSREKARAAEYLADGWADRNCRNMSAEDAALELLDRADQDLSCDDHYREQVGPLQPRDFGY